VISFVGKDIEVVVVSKDAFDASNTLLKCKIDLFSPFQINVADLIFGGYDELCLIVIEHTKFRSCFQAFFVFEDSLSVSTFISVVESAELVFAEEQQTAVIVLVELELYACISELEFSNLLYLILLSSFV